MSENSWVIGDKELENLLEDGQDKLGTTKHVNQLFKIITDLSADELEKGFNIGLYGGWGSGKSSITNALKKRINSERGNEFGVIDFDCWKYSNDDLRRSILFEISKLYKDSNLTEKLEQVFYFDKSKSKETEEINKDLLKKICIIGAPLLIGFGMIKWLWEDSSILEAVCGSGIILLLIKSIIELISKGTLISKLKKILSKIDISSINNLNIKDFIPTVKISRTISEEKIFSGEQFESLFKILIGREVEGYNQFGEIKEIIKKAKLLKDKKVLLIFDNIDRCESASVKEILMTIKTFLNQDNCIFLLPIDYENVCKSYESYDQGDEYLRKIFNLGINLKQPHYSKLSDLVMDLMETNLRKDEKGLNITDDESSTIAYILASAFADNPRKIKQFLNQLGAEYILYEKKRAILSILKELILRLEIPKLYKYLTEDQNIVFANEKLKDFINNITFLKDEKGDDYIFNEKEQILLNKLGGIEEELILLDDDNVKLEKAYNSPKDFIELIKRDKLKDDANKFLRSNIEVARKGGKKDKKNLLKNSIYYMSEYGIDKILFNNIFDELSEFGSNDIMDEITLMDAEVLHKFLYIAGEKRIKKLPKVFRNMFTERFFTEESIDNDITEFKKLDKNIQNLVISDDAIINYYETNLKNTEENKNVEELNYFRFLQSFQKYVDDKFIRHILKDIDPNSFDFGVIKSLNVISIIALCEHFPDDILEKIFKICERFVQGYAHFIRNYEGTNKKEVDSYLKCVRIILIDGDNENLHDKLVEKLVDLYNSYQIPQFKENVYNIFLEEFDLREPYKWPYADIVIDKNNIKDIERLINNTSNNGETRIGLENQQIERIINKISREDDAWNNIIQSIRKNESIKDILFNRINGINDDNEKISKIKKLDTLGILTEKDKELFGNELTSKLKIWLESGSIEDMEKVCDFIEDYHNSSIIKYIDYNCVYESLKSFDMNVFKSQYNADVFDCYKSKKAKALRYLTNINKNFNNLNNKK